MSFLLYNEYNIDENTAFIFYFYSHLINKIGFYSLTFQFLYFLTLVLNFTRIL